MLTSVEEWGGGRSWGSKSLGKGGEAENEHRRDTRSLGKEGIRGWTETFAHILMSMPAAAVSVFRLGGWLGFGIFLNSIMLKVQKMAVLQIISFGGRSKQNGLHGDRGA